MMFWFFLLLEWMKSTVVVGASKLVNVKMKDKESKNLDEVVVIAYGKAKKSLLYTGSAISIKGEDLNNRPLTNVLSAIEGATSGVQIQSAAGQPGSAPALEFVDLVQSTDLILLCMLLMECRLLEILVL